MKTNQQINEISHSVIFLKWTALVMLNALFGLAMNFYAMWLSPIIALAIFAAIATFILLYATLDIYLIEKQLHQWRNALLAGVLIKSVMQLFPFIDIIAGSIAIGIVSGEGQLNKSGSFMDYYLITLIDGFLLSIVAGILSVLVRLTIKAIDRRKTQKSARLTDPVA